MPYLSAYDTGSKLIDSAIQARGWTEDLIRCEKTGEPKRALLSFEALKSFGKPAARREARARMCAA
jgi:hypothetical protein